MRFEFDDCELDTDRYELRRGDVVQPVEPQVFDVLAMLLRERGRVVPKEEILDAVWSSRFVSESALTSRIKAARRAIGDDGQEQRLIRTVRGRGYQFVGDVAVGDAVTAAPREATVPHFRLDAVDLLERDEAVDALAQAYDAAARGRGGVVLLGGEPGIGKTAVVTHFVAGLTGARVLWGACDDLLTPKPLGPLRDLTGVSELFEQLVAAGADPHEIHGRLLAELSSPPTPTVLVIEDVHWADDATLDAVTFIGRRITTLPALLVLTFRAGDVIDGHPLHAALAAIHPATTRYIQLDPLSRAAVATLAGERADEVYAATGGAPFYVTEMLAAEPGTVPPSVVHAVLGRTARLGEDARRLVELVSVVPTRTSTAVLDMVQPTWTGAAEEPERRQLLQVAPDHVQFRHELSRHAIRSKIPGSRRRRLHAEILGALLKIGADPADIVHHAEAAGELGVAADHALVAARKAAAVGSNREAYSQFVRASRFADRLSRPDQAALFEELANAAYLLARMDEAFAALDRAIDIHRELAADEAVGRCIRIRSRFHWYAGNGEQSLRDAGDAVAILEPLGESAELARAYSGLSQLAMLAGQDDEALTWGERAVELATRMGDERTRAHALVNLGTAHMRTNAGDFVPLEQAHRLADTIGDRHEAVRALLNAGFTAMTWLRTALAWEFTGRAMAYASEHQVDTLLSYANTMSAWLQARKGDLDEAERIARAEAATSRGVAQLLARTVLAELAVRRGDSDASTRLAEVAAEADRTGELQRIAPVLALEIELSLTTGRPVPTERLLRALELAQSISGRAWSGADLEGWASVAGIDVKLGGAPMPDAFAAMVRRDWAAAAAAFGQAGWTYDRALMLSLLEDQAALAEALEVARALGARPLAERVTRRMRDLGSAVPAGG